VIGIVRLEKSRHPDLDPVSFATIDGDRYHQVQEGVVLGDDLVLWEEGDNSRPMACDLRWVLQQAAGYMTGSQEGVTREGAAEPTRQEENERYGEGGVLDAEEDQAHLDRQAEEEE
jgi:hypothetical protein